MKKFKRIYLKVSVIFALLIALVCTFYAAISNDEIVAKINNPPESEDYQILKDYAMIYAKTFDKNSVNDSSVEINHKFQDGYLTVTVNELRCRIKANFPIEMVSLENEEDFKIRISYQEVEFEEYSNLSDSGIYIAALILFFILVSAPIFFIIYYPVIFIAWIVTKCNKEEKHPE